MKINFRANLVFVFLILFGAGLIYRLVFVQVKDGGYWRALAQGQQKYFSQGVGDRGTIFCKDVNSNLYTLAANKEVFLACVSIDTIFPQEDGGESVIGQLSEFLSEDREELLARLKDSKSYCTFLKELTEEEAGRLIEMDLLGVHVEKEQVRYYPHQDFASHVLGFVGGEGIGQYGIEGQFEEELKGSSGISEVERAPNLLISKSKIQKGKNVYLTIDYNIQFQAEKILEEKAETLGYQEGTVIVADPFTGKVIALANYPSFDPNEYNKEKGFEIFLDPAVQRTYEPGSVFKPITMAAGLDLNVIDPQTTYIDEGSLTISGRTFYNYDHRIWGKRTMTEVLERSINTGAAFAEEKVGHENFLDYLEKFGFFEPTNIELQGEVFSENNVLRKGYDINFATASFGQGVEVTPVQLIRAFSAIANGGKLIDLRITENGANKAESKQIISSKTASQLSAMMVSVTENGYGKDARIPGYYIAGKTGTAQIAWTSLGISKSGYSEKTNQSFIGFTPALNPRFLILVKLYNPKTSTAEYSAIPVFKELSQYIIDYWQVPPDYDVSEK